MNNSVFITLKGSKGHKRAKKGRNWQRRAIKGGKILAVHDNEADKRWEKARNGRKRQLRTIKGFVPGILSAIAGIR